MVRPVKVVVRFDDGVVASATLVEHDGEYAWIFSCECGLLPTCKHVEWLKGMVRYGG